MLIAWMITGLWLLISVNKVFEQLVCNNLSNVEMDISQFPSENNKSVEDAVSQYPAACGAPCHLCKGFDAVRLCPSNFTLLTSGFGNV